MRRAPDFVEMDKNSGRADRRSAVARVGGILKNDTDILRNVQEFGGLRKRADILQ